MTTSVPAASVRVWSPPQRPSRAVVVTVSCPARSTRLPHLLRSDDASGRSTEIEAVVTLAALRHRERCAACDPEPVHAKGARWLRPVVERLARNAAKPAAGRLVVNARPESRRN